MWANTYDARSDPDDPVWWWARKAARISVRLSWPVRPCGHSLGGRRGRVGGIAGRRPPGGWTGAWIDGGPRARFFAERWDGLALIHRESVELGSAGPGARAAVPRADLAADQLAAVGHRSGPARIIAPAGSGKTRVLTERLRHLMVDRGTNATAVLAVAYNKKAQEELEERTADVPAPGAHPQRPRLRLLADARGGAAPAARRAGGAAPDREARARSGGSGPTPIRSARTSRRSGQVRLGLRDPEEVEAWRDDVPGLAAAFDPYRAALREAGAVDFDEQIYGAIEALLADGAFRRRAQAGCRHLLVDEFQDLTPAHVLLLRLLAVARARRVRRGRRRPGHLRPRRAPIPPS